VPLKPAEPRQPAAQGAAPLAIADLVVGLGDGAANAAGGRRPVGVRRWRWGAGGPRAGALRGVEAVVDKDLTAALLAEGLGADALLLLTDMPAVQRNFGAADAEPIGHTTPAELRRMRFPAG